MSDIFREVDEEIRQDRALEFWRKYQGLLLGLAILIVCAAAGWRFWETRREAAANAASAQFQVANNLSQEGKATEAQAAYAALARGDMKGYADLAALRAAAERAVYDKPGAIADFDALAKDEKLESLFRDTARLRAALLRVDGADRKEMEERLTPLAAPGAPYRSSARELLALVAMRDDDLKAAGKWLDQIAVDVDAPPTLKQRAQALMAIVRSGRKS